MAKITEKKAKKAALQVNENPVEEVVVVEEVKEEKKWPSCEIIAQLEKLRSFTGQNTFSFDEIKAILNSVFKK